MSLQEAHGPSLERQKISGPSDYMKKYLYVCLMPFPRSRPPLWFSVHSIPVESLVTPDSPPPVSSSYEQLQDDQLLQLMDQVLYLGDVQNAFSDRSGFVCLGDTLCIFGGHQIAASRLLFSSTACCFDFSGISNGVNPAYDQSHKNEVHPSCKNEMTLLRLLPSMDAQKYNPIVVHIGGLIYVLASGPLVGLVEPFFEVFDPRDNSSSSLPSPPLNGRPSRADFFFLSYLVVNGKLCVSAGAYSLAFDTKNRKWDACELFCGFSHPRNFNIMDEGYKLNPIAFGGPPFRFIRQAIAYEEDILICVVKLHLVAYQIVDGKVKNVQVLLGIEDGGACENLVDLGGGYICYQCQIHSDDRLSQYSCLKFVTFKVSKISGGRAVRDGSDSEFLQCEHLNTLIQKIKAGVRYRPVYSFPLW